MTMRRRSSRSESAAASSDPPPVARDESTNTGIYWTSASAAPTRKATQEYIYRYLLNPAAANDTAGNTGIYWPRYACRFQRGGPLFCRFMIMSRVGYTCCPCDGGVVQRRERGVHGRVKVKTLLVIAECCFVLLAFSSHARMGGGGGSTNHSPTALKRRKKKRKKERKKKEDRLACTNSIL